jgi:hypothetical protein
MALLTSTLTLAGPVTTAASSLETSAFTATSVLSTSTPAFTSARPAFTDTTTSTTDTDRSDNSSPESTGTVKIIVKLEEGTTASNFFELYKPSDGNSTLTAESAPDKAHLIDYQPMQGMEAVQYGPAELVLPPLTEGEYRATGDGAGGVKKGDQVKGDLALLYLAIRLPYGSDLMLSHLVQSVCQNADHQCVIERYDTKAVLSANRQTQDETFAIKAKAWDGVVGVQAANQAYRIVGETENEQVKMKCQIIATQLKKMSY